MKNLNRKKIENVIIVISIIMLLIGIIIRDANVLLISTLMIFCENCICSIFDIKNNFIFLVFNINFFILLLGKYVVLMLNGEEWPTKFSNNIYINTIILLYISLISLYIGTKIYIKLKEKYGEQNSNKGNKYKEVLFNQEFKNATMKITQILYYIALICATVVVLEKIIYVQQNSYLALYKGFISKIPGIIHKIANTKTLSLLIYLFLYPNKKNTFITVATYLIYLVLTIFTGVRGDFVIGIIIIIICFIFRQLKIKDIKILRKKTIPIFIMVIITMIVGLSAYKTLRNGVQIKNFNIINEVKQFFLDQGGSADIISYVQKYESKLPSSNISYTFGPFINYFTNGTIARIITGNNGSQTTKEEIALYNNNLGATISYLVMPQQYLQGHGLGTQYIAELYADFSYIGVIIYNILLGMLLIKIMNINKENYFLLGFVMNLLQQIIYLPRQFATAWIVNSISFGNITVIAIIIIYSVMQTQKIDMKSMKDMLTKELKKYVNNTINPLIEKTKEYISNVINLLIKKLKEYIKSIKYNLIEKIKELKTNNKGE